MPKGAETGQRKKIFLDFDGGHEYNRDCSTILAGNSTRLKLLYLLDYMKELCVCDLEEMLGVSVSAVSQHLAKLKAYGLVAPRRDAQTIYYRLTEHAFNAKLRENFFKQFQV